MVCWAQISWLWRCACESIPCMTGVPFRHPIGRTDVRTGILCWHWSVGVMWCLVRLYKYERSPAFPSLVLKRLVDSHAPADSIRGATVSLSRHKYGSEAERDSSLPIAKSINTTVKMLVSPDASVWLLPGQLKLLPHPLTCALVRTADPVSLVFRV